MANKLRFWRRRAKLSQEALADMAGLSHVQISRLERGLSFFSEGSLERIAAALGVRPEEIVSADEVETPEVAEAQSILKSVKPEDRQRLIAIMRTFVPPH
jgi:transcriptional regulator with XRE-family HTH domain